MTREELRGGEPFKEDGASKFAPTTLLQKTVHLMILAHDILLILLAIGDMCSSG